MKNYILNKDIVEIENFENKAFLTIGFIGFITILFTLIIATLF